MLTFVKRFLAFLVLLLIVLDVVFITFPLKGHIPVLMYHYVVPEKQVGPTTLDVSTKNFEQQMWFLKRFGFRPITLERLYQIKTGKAKALGKEIVITFDDGNKSYAEYAMPILEKYEIPSANFIIWDALANDLYGSMNTETAKKIAKNPLVTFGSHTVEHSSLDQVDLQKAEKEIFESRTKLKREFQTRIDYFSYPVGAYTDAVMSLVQKAGYRLSFTTSIRNLCGHPETLFNLPRIKIGRDDPLFVFWLKASGLADYTEKVKLFRKCKKPV
ncbi:MAG: hypothetical protein A3G33_10090 [Omnitrophica bacterium RIFCSPLOWO2_12_FULL_44_17]|uniref:NodB homology domain-containing protein n=1 Tax=Candidatus Danuiimicrobium aquiferis TaxID=1801832 RepID=A0A1G1L1Y4_9BACT|nr:MAG: hypothetical protein A3B72_08520 [Omnitrophica bacterium RIFCSPHIGHO2_02_FULL_45_28]OGW91296.1 MAG: hypothetical protein A3E74_10035 [Omnitrophica bacterium RIFCSPHIGHO2_12_FULL_44_12]OGW99172.1 MAG: hypothetical protein A3G33_10090 [Omnitrophica bacterium RIFCSPLOWO2_12_FULL_44_17]OGX04412.1 MAG: hypothetical protein A3J12_00520 [Omnitrophica bacterium RIFCSPLOWO2_02_FULL_44_11]